MTADSIVVVGAAGTQARAMLQYLSRAMDLSGLVAVDLHWPDAVRTEVEQLGAEVITGNVLADDRDRLLKRKPATALLVNLAGPYYVIGTSLLELALELGADYLDICDDVDATERLLELDGDARRKGIRALIGMGSSPGTTNVLIRTALDALGTPERATVDLAWTVDRADMTRAAFDHVMHCFATALPGSMGVPDWDDLEPRYVDFPPPVGRQLTVRLGHPEPLTISHFAGVPQAVNRGGTSPDEHAHLTWAIARLIDPKQLEGAVDDRLWNLYCQYDRIGAERWTRIGSGLQIDVTVDGDGYRFASGLDMTMEEATGTPAAAGVLLMLDRALPDPGVWAPECLAPISFFEKVRQVSSGGGGLHLLHLRDGRPAEPGRIRDLLKKSAQ